MTDLTSVTGRVYLDHAATTPLRPEVYEAMLPWLGLAADGKFGNASTLSAEGKLARQALESARATIAQSIGASPLEVIFNSGGTESNNALLFGITGGVRSKLGEKRGGNRIVSSAIEHHAVLEPVKALRRNGWQAELVKPTRDGLIEPAALEALLDTVANETTTLVSMMTVNNEIGTIQPIANLSHISHNHGALFHTDAVQALGKMPFDVHQLGIDAASFSAHKIGGPKGVGAFYLRSLTPFISQQHGGGQERGLRSGTANVVGAIGFAKALELATIEQTIEVTRLNDLIDRLTGKLMQSCPCVQLTVSSQAKRLPNILSILVEGFESESLILKLDEQGFAISGGSACSTGSLEPSHVLLAMGLSRKQAQSVLRISIGHSTTAVQIDSFVRALAQIVR
ncbi:MAG: cysteine desulfurase [Coriobacteriales bacterium]|jgi:cysteine desulfurase|nr:cysteine desulfurase [Coriobacteriales bacterium]